MHFEFNRRKVAVLLCSLMRVCLHYNSAIFVLVVFFSFVFFAVLFFSNVCDILGDCETYLIGTVYF